MDINILFCHLNQSLISYLDINILFCNSNWGRISYLDINILFCHSNWSRISYLDINILFCHLCIMFVMLSCLFIAALWSPVGKGLTSLLSYVVLNCIFVTSHVVSRVRCDTWLYRFLIFVPFLTLTSKYRLDLVQSINKHEKPRWQPCFTTFGPWRWAP